MDKHLRCEQLMKNTNKEYKKLTNALHSLLCGDMKAQEVNIIAENVFEKVDDLIDKYKKEGTKMDALTIASRAGKGFYKSYVKNIKLAECRPIPGHKEGWDEKDYFFDYKDKKYRINESICPNDKGEIIYSAKYRYELVEC